MKKGRITEEELKRCRVLMEIKEGRISLREASEGLGIA